MFQCSDFKVWNCTFTTCGAAVCAVESFNFEISNNKSTFVSVTGVTHHDGIMDAWGGSHDFIIDNNQIDAGSIIPYPILVTGQKTDLTAAGCYNFKITGNKCYNAKQVGIWISGRNGVNHDFVVSDNIVDTVVAGGFYGIGVFDSQKFSVTGNITKQTNAQGMYFGRETAAGGVTGATDGSISGNVVFNANAGLAAGSLAGCGIAVAENSTRLSLSANRIKGALHTVAMHFDTTATNNEVLGYDFDLGTTGVMITNLAPTNDADFVYVPVLTNTTNVSASQAYQAMVTRKGNVVTVHGALDITPTANGLATILGISIPVASNFTNAITDASGQANSLSNVNAGIIADTVNDRCTLQFTSTNAVLNRLYYTFSYTLK
jgi:hypothetical protein